MPAKWQRVTDPELAEQLYASGLLYEFGGIPPKGAYFVDRRPEPAFGWNNLGWDWALGLSNWSFYVLLEE